MSASNTPRTDAAPTKAEQILFWAERRDPNSTKLSDCENELFALARDLERENARLREALRGIVERPEVFGIHDEVPSGKRIIAVVSMANWEAARAALVQS